MAELIINTGKIKNNIKKLSLYFETRNIMWSLVTKVFSGNKTFLKKVLTTDVINKIYSVGDSRLTSLRNLKALNPTMRTIYIKPPAIVYADDIVKYADVSLNSSLRTIKALNNSAKTMGKIHSIIIMIEQGELREGILPNDILEFCKNVFLLQNIRVIGIGSNLGCMYGVEPTFEKLQQLSRYKELISKNFNIELPLISGGTSITLPLLESGRVPQKINHFRVGEAAFFGTSPLNNQTFLDLHTDTFRFKANIIELAEKNVVPEGVISDANIGHTAEYNENALHKTSVKAILDFGLLDVDSQNIEPKDDSIAFIGITSDMIVMDLGINLAHDGSQKYKVGDKIEFKLNYMAVARLLNSNFIDRVFLD